MKFLDTEITADEVRDYRTDNCVGIREAVRAMKREKIQDLLNPIIFSYSDEHFEDKIITLAKILNHIITEEI